MAGEFTTDDFLLRVSRGQIDGITMIHKFGKGTVGTTERDIWDGNLDYVYQSAAITLYLSSSNAGDNTDIFISGLDIDGIWQTETVTLTGQTQVATVNDYARIFRMEHKPSGGGWGGSSILAGDVYASSTNGDTTAGVPQTVADIKAKILVGEDQTLMALFTIPLGFTGFILDFDFYTDSNKALTSRVRIREFGSSAATKSFFSAGNPEIKRGFGLVNQIPEQSDIRLTASVSATTSAVSVHFDVLLVDNSLVRALNFDTDVVRRG